MCASASSYPGPAPAGWPWRRCSPRRCSPPQPGGTSSGRAGWRSARSPISPPSRCLRGRDGSCRPSPPLPARPDPMRLLFILLIGTLTTCDILQTGMSLAPGISVKNAILYPIALGLIFRMALTGRFRMRLPTVNAAFIIWITYAFLTWVACVTMIHYPGYDARGLFIELKSMLIDSALFFFVYFYGAEGEKEFYALTRTLAFCISVANHLTIADLAGIVHLGITVGSGGVEADRVFGVFGHANDTATVIVCTLPMLVTVAISSRSAARIFWYAGVFASLAVLVLTVSRGAYVGVIVGYGAAVWLCLRYLPTSRVVSWTMIG